jgi:GTPase Era involved in 16S rRNA processing
MNDDRYTGVKQKCIKVNAILRDISTLIGAEDGKWVKLETGDTVMPGLGLSHDATHLVNCANYIQQGIFKIVVLGMCKTGKSTLLNALLGARLLLTDKRPITAVVTNVVYGSSSEVMIYEEGKEHLYPIDWSSFTRDFSLSQKTINSIDTQGNIETPLKRIRYAQVEHSSSLLNHCIRLTDTPGLNVSINRSIITPTFLKRSDTAIIFVLNAMHPFPREVQTYLTMAFGSTPRQDVFFVVNRIDQMIPEKIDALKRHVRTMLRQHFLDGNYMFDNELYKRRVFFVSAENALSARTANPQALGDLESSGILLLEDELALFLTAGDRITRVLEPTLHTLEHIVGRAYRHIVQERTTLPTEGSEASVSFSIVRKKKHLDTIEKKLHILLDEANKVIFRKLAQIPDERLHTGPLLIDETIARMSLYQNIEAHLHFIKQVIERVDTSLSTHSELQEALDELFYRHVDPYLYMAVIGEFNSGKSTFINALLRQEILKTSALVATAISAHIRYSSSPDVAVLFKKQREALSYSRDATRLWQLIEFFMGQRQKREGSFRECLHALTATDSVASHIDHLLITHPATFLSEAVTIIDTPGLNAENPQHAEITTNIIKREADVTVVLIPASFPLSMMLRDFLSQQLFPLHKPCLFILTQMDKVEIEQQEQVLEYTRARLAELEGIKKPVVLYETAARVILDTLAEHRMVGQELSHWNDRFIELEDRLWKHLQHERVLSLTGRAVRLLDRLFEQLSNYLNAQQACENEVARLNMLEIRRRRELLQEKQQQLENLLP